MLIYMDHTITFIVKRHPDYFKNFNEVQQKQINEQQKYYII